MWKPNRPHGSYAAAVTTPIGRLAPSPTGRLHVGHARTFLLAWWSLRSRGGRVLLRMEDLDRERVRPGMEAGVLEDLEWLGLDWDGPVLRQSERGEAYAEAVARLSEAGHLYPCVCTRREIAAAQSAPHAEAGGAYPGTCAGLYASEEEARRASGRDPALRFRVPGGARVVADGHAGSYSEDLARSVGDFPVTRRDGEPAYQLAVVVDDAEQGVTEVLRGDDLLSSTVRQACLQEALGLPHPTWVHVPLVVDGEGRRLAKRADDLALASLREAGVAAGELVRWAARSAGLEDRGVGPAGVYVEGFRLEALPREPCLTFSPGLD